MIENIKFNVIEPFDIVYSFINFAVTAELSRLNIKCFTVACKNTDVKITKQQEKYNHATFNISYNFNNGLQSNDILGTVKNLSKFGYLKEIDIGENYLICGLTKTDANNYLNQQLDKNKLNIISLLYQEYETQLEINSSNGRNK